MKFIPKQLKKSVFGVVGLVSEFVFSTAKSFFKNDCYTKASALAFYSLLSIVPVLAVIFGIAQGFGFEKALKEEISKYFFQQPVIQEKLTQFATSWLQNVKGGVIAGVGTIFLFWSVTSLLSSIESYLNEIWMVQNGRSFMRKIRDYLTIFFIAPLFFVTASSINIYLSTKITETAKSYVFIETISPFLLFFLNLFPFFLIWMLFTFLYAFIPNAKVKFLEAFIAGVLAGTAFQIWQWFYINFQVSLSSYGAIYGSFAALPLFFMWLQFSWLIFLAGAEIAASIKNGFFYLNKQQHPISVKILALSIVYWCAQAFADGEAPPTEIELEKKLGISPRNLQDILEILSKNRIISKAFIADNALGYQPARSIREITVQTVCEAVEKNHEILAYIEDKAILQKMENILTKINNEAANSLEKNSFSSLIKK